MRDTRSLYSVVSVTILESLSAQVEGPDQKQEYFGIEVFTMRSTY